MCQEVLDYMNVVDTRLFPVVLLKEPDGEGCPEELWIFFDESGPMLVISLIGLCLCGFETSPKEMLKVWKFPCIRGQLQVLLNCVRDIDIVRDKHMAEYLFG
jgi:hypothetical protein